MSDPTDPGGVGAHGERGRSPTRVGDTGSPVGSPLTIVLALIAVVVGFLIFRSIDNSDAGGIGGAAEATSTVAGGATSSTAAGATTTTAAPTTTRPERVTEGATVIVANAASASGVARAMTDELDGAGYATADPTDATGENLDTSIIYFVESPPQIRAVAESVARDLGGLQARPMPQSVPIAGSLGTATVLLMLGDDIAGDTLEQIGARSGPNVQAPAPAGNTTTAG